MPAQLCEKTLLSSCSANCKEKSKCTVNLEHPRISSITLLGGAQKESILSGQKGKCKLKGSVLAKDDSYDILFFVSFGHKTII